MDDFPPYCFWRVSNYATFGGGKALVEELIKLFNVECQIHGL